MIASFLLALREGLEAALIIGVTLGVLSKMQQSRLVPMVWLGVGLAAAASLGAALGLAGIGAELEGRAEEIFEGVTMFLAAGVLTWMIFWMQRQGRQAQSELETGLRAAAGRGRAWGVFAIAFVAVLREGIETALFLVAAAMTATAGETVLGALLGLTTAAVLGWLLFAATVRLDVRRFFQVTGALLILFAAGLVAHGVHEFNEAGLIPSLVAPVWDLSPVLSSQSPLGSLLRTLFGYNATPSLTEVLAYLSYFVLVVGGARLAARPRPAPASSAEG